MLLVCISFSLHADLLEDGARSLARKVVTSIRGASVTLDLENVSDLNEKRILDLSLAFQDEMRRRGVKILPKNGDLKIRVTISRNALEYLGIARLERQDSAETFLVSLGQSAEGFGLQQSTGLTLRRELIFSSAQLILDLIFHGGNPTQIEVLEPRQITFYERDGDKWVRGTSLKLPRNGPIGRDLRGQLNLGIDDMSAVFPTEICNISVNDGDHCHANSGQVRLSEAPEQMVENKESPPWITATQFPIEGINVLLVAGKDGKLRFYGDDSEPFATLSTFGDQVSSIRTDCASGWQALVTLKGDLSKTDSVEGIEIRDSKPVVVTQPLQFDGPVIALRRGDRSFAFQPTSAIAIVFNLQTGLYEAYRLTVTCAA
jgi:hypothetical protein